MALDPFDEVLAFYTGPCSEPGEAIRLLFSDLGAWAKQVPVGSPEFEALVDGLTRVSKEVAAKARRPVLRLATNPGKG